MPDDADDFPAHLPAHDVFARETALGAQKPVVSEIRRVTSSIRPIACSATDWALPPAWLTTRTPAPVQPGRRSCRTRAVRGYAEQVRAARKQLVGDEPLLRQLVLGGRYLERMRLRQVLPNEIGVTFAFDRHELDVGLARETRRHRGVIPLLESNYELVPGRHVASPSGFIRPADRTFPAIGAKEVISPAILVFIASLPCRRAWHSRVKPFARAGSCRSPTP
jgi:hypothetical protein